MSIARVLKNNSSQELTRWLFMRTTGLLTASLRVLPNFLIIGAQRCGTTSLFKYLIQHPDVQPSFPKEVHFFSNYFHKGINWYRSHFPLRRYKTKSGGGQSSFITGEATPYYLSHPHAARRAAQVVPGSRLIVLLRNPVERAYSHYIHEVNSGVETLSFGEAVHKEEERLDQELQRMIEDENYRSFNYQHYSYLSRGLYLEQIQVWLRYFSRDSMLFLDSEKLDSDPQDTFRTMTDFLGLRRWDQIDFSKYHTSSYPVMDLSIKEELSGYFRPYNQKLFEFTNINLGD